MFTGKNTENNLADVRCGVFCLRMTVSCKAERPNTKRLVLMMLESRVVESIWYLVPFLHGSLTVAPGRVSSFRVMEKNCELCRERAILPLSDIYTCSISIHSGKKIRQHRIHETTALYKTSHIMNTIASLLVFEAIDADYSYVTLILLLFFITVIFYYCYFLTTGTQTLF